jgi:gluconolactonase
MWTHATPDVRDLEPFTRLPDSLRRTGELTAWSVVNRLGVPGDSFLEGPVFDDDGNLFVTDVEHGRVFRVDPTGAWTVVAEFDGEPNGLAVLRPGTLLTTDYRNGLRTIDVGTGTVAPFLERRNAERFKGVNDLVFDSAGSLYFTDQGQTGLHDPTGRVYRLGRDGRLDVLVRNVPGPNSLVLSPDERVLFVAATRDNSVWRIPLMSDGGVAKVGRYFSANGPAGPDGLAMDVAGRLVVTLAGRGLVVVLDRFGEPVHVLRSGTGSMVTNVAYGGADRTTVYVTEAETGTILRAALDTPGCTVHTGQPP